ncbi:hypothetical protein CDES_13795 [Corynebacterium deserti GIMN1.010]|uniref:Uncharacterized protein n=1 Tax=Corynebacterium deserti GIMN1.010 TaxID=931089 RepID=A0A0M5IMI3_9CORY|nr:DUF1684 domain-containing protein [Corynebacterium deserti]ALC07086.1 hypothetical protein CDES_13795 [Corynebacterium deserti GIMN1.010]
MTTTLSPQTDWNTWHLDRSRRALSSAGALNAVRNYRITADTLAGAQAISGLPGRWYRSGGGVVGVRLEQPLSTTGTEQLHPGEILQSGPFTLAVAKNLGELSLLVFDLSRSKRDSSPAIAAFPPSPEWIVEGRFFPAGKLTDKGGTGIAQSIEQPIAGWVHFLRDRRDYRLQVLHDGNTYKALFSDNSVNLGVHPIRCIEIVVPDHEGNTVLDFNRAYLPDSALNSVASDPTPNPNNTLDLSITAGEKWVVRD